MDKFAREIAAQHPDFVLNTLNGDSNLYFFRALRKAGVRAEDIPVFSTSIAEVELAEMGPELMAGHYAAWNYFQSVQSEREPRFHRTLPPPLRPATRAGRPDGGGLYRGATVGELPCAGRGRWT